MTSKWKVIIRHSNWTTKRWHKYHGCDSTVNFSKSNSPWTIYTAHIYVHWIGCSMYTVSISHTKWTESLSHINVMPFCADIWAIAMQRRISRKFDFLLCTLLFSRRSFSVSPNHATSETPFFVSSTSFWAHFGLHSYILVWNALYCNFFS